MSFALLMIDLVKLFHILQDIQATKADIQKCTSTGNGWQKPRDTGQTKHTNHRSLYSHIVTGSLWSLLLVLWLRQECKHSNSTQVKVINLSKQTILSFWNIHISTLFMQWVGGNSVSLVICIFPSWSSLQQSYLIAFIRPIISCTYQSAASFWLNVAASPITFEYCFLLFNSWIYTLATVNCFISDKHKNLSIFAISNRPIRTAQKKTEFLEFCF